MRALTSENSLFTCPHFSHAKTLECEKCQCVGFKQTMMLKKLSALVSPTGQEAIVPVGVFACDHCGHVNKEFREAEIQKA